MLSDCWSSSNSAIDFRHPSNANLWVDCDQPAKGGMAEESAPDVGGSGRAVGEVADKTSRQPDSMKKIGSRDKRRIEARDGGWLIERLNKWFNPMRSSSFQVFGRVRHLCVSFQQFPFERQRFLCFFFSFWNSFIGMKCSRVPPEGPGLTCSASLAPLTEFAYAKLGGIVDDWNVTS